MLECLGTWLPICLFWATVFWEKSELIGNQSVEVGWPQIQTYGFVNCYYFVREYHLWCQYVLPCHELIMEHIFTSGFWQRFYPLTLCYSILINSFFPFSNCTPLILPSQIIQCKLLILFLKYFADSATSFSLLWNQGWPSPSSLFRSFFSAGYTTLKSVSPLLHNWKTIFFFYGNSITWLPEGPPA